MIGLTGGIGTGKTTVSDYLIQKGYPVIDADKMARELLNGRTETSLQVIRKVTEAFGEDVLQEDGLPNRKKLGDIVFRDKASKERLEEITHGMIFSMIHQSIKEGRDKGWSVLFLDAPLLFETNLDRYTDETWLLDLEDGIRIPRVIQRDGLSREEIQRRIDHQMPREEKRKRASWVIDNSGTLEELYQTINQRLEQELGLTSKG